jgi:hypothetical protein
MDIFQDFDWKKYVEYYNDTKNINNKNDAIKHWINIGNIENRKYFTKKYENNEINENNDYEIFDWEKYVDFYKDLKNVLKNKKDAYNHWTNYGIKEGRIFFKNYTDICYKRFDWIKYRRYYNDLNGKINNKKDAVKHWKTIGEKENRIFFLYKDGKMDNYIDDDNSNLTKNNIKKNNDNNLKKMNENHSNKNNKNNTKKNKDCDEDDDNFDFNVNYDEDYDDNDYINNKNNIINKKNDELYDINIFDWEKYVNFYEDLKHLDKKGAIKHWTNNGINEGRHFFKINDNQNDEYNENDENDENDHYDEYNYSSNTDESDESDNEKEDYDIELFDWEKYVNFYDDLKHVITCEPQAKYHWINNGFNEGRKFFKKLTPKDILKMKEYKHIQHEFDWKTYINYYSDLSNLNTKSEAIEHWLNIGFKEKRNYIKYTSFNIEDFDWEKYLDYYKDLNNLFFTRDDAIKHWNNYGKEEGRIFFRYENHETNLIDESVFEDFDWEKYVSSYDDIRYINSKKEAISHWIKIGSYENRKYYTYNNSLLENNKNLLLDNYKNNDINVDDKYKYFDWEKYCKFYKDTKNIKSKEDAIIHYKKYNDNNIEFFTNNIEFKEDNNINNQNYNIYKILDNIIIFSVDNIKKDCLSDLNIFYFKNQLYEDDEDKIINNISFLKNINLSINDNLLFINNKNISFDYLKYYKKPIKKIFENEKKYDIIQLSLNISKNNFYDIIEKDIVINEFDKNNFDCYYITKLGVEKLINENYNILEEWNIGFYSRPLFGYYNKNIDNKNMWNLYYRVCNYWDKIYCINSCYQIEKRNTMKKYCNLMNCIENDLFYDKILDCNLPNFNQLVNMNIFDNLFDFNKRDDLGINITYLNIINESIKNKYNNILITDDNIEFKNDYFMVLNEVFNNYLNIDILYIGHLENYNLNDLKSFEIMNDYKLYIISKNIDEDVNIDGTFAISLSNKALNAFKNMTNPFYYDTNKIINKLCFNQNEKYNLKCFFVDINTINKKNNNIEYWNDKLNNLVSNKTINYLSKIKKINFKMNYNYNLKIYVSPLCEEYYINIIKLIFKKLKNYSISKYIDDNCDIVIFSSNEDISLLKSTLNICFNYNNSSIDDDIDISISGSLNNITNYNIYFPYLFLNLWDRKNNGKYLFHKDNLYKNKKYFCGYLENINNLINDNIYEYLSKYKSIDKLDEIYNNTKYSDLLVEKYSDYRFILLFENDISYGYISEKIINPILANSIPIYGGNEYIFKYINKKRVINIKDFKNINDLIEHIESIDNNEDLYNSIINEPIFVSNINYDNFELYISDKLDKSLGLKSKNIKLGNFGKNIDLFINNLILDNNDNYDNNYIKKYLYNFIRDDDNIII